MSIEMLAVGDELLSGATQDTNSSFAARELFALGLQLQRVTVVGDRPADLRAAVEEALRRSRALVVTGGLGPTPDDLTKEVFAEHFGDPLELDIEVLNDIRRRFESRGKVMPEINVKQAFLPRAAVKIPNPVGSAPGVHWSRAGHEIFLLPGVPLEMQAMFRDTVLPVLKRLFPNPGLRFAAFRTCGVAESELAQRLQPFVVANPDVAWAFYPSWGNVDIKIRRIAGDDASWTALCDGIRAALGRALYTTDDASLAEVVQRLLLERGWKLAVAESCTGGMVSSRITDIAGSSAVFHGGFVTYANAAKEAWLGVPAEMLRQHGAVSAPVAAALARGALRAAHANVAVSVTGVAGPTGGTPEKPVGLIYLGLATPDGAWTKQLQLWARRDTNRAVASLLALDMVRRHLLGMPVGDAA